MRRALLASLLIIGVTGSGTAVADTPATPFRGTIDAITTPLGPTTDCTLFLQSDQSGVATHLGRYQGPGTTCGFNFRVVGEPPFNPGGEPPYLVADFINEQTWIAANGDQLLVTTLGVRVQSIPDGSRGVRGEMTIHGGTGRFAGATGEALGSRDADEEVISFDGWIEYDASNASG